MFSRPALVVFSVAVAEFFVFVYLAKVFGGLAVALVAVLLTLGGLFFLVRFAPQAFRQGLRQLLESGGDVSAEQAGDQAGLVVAGFLLAIPGILTGAVGLLLLVKPIRSLFSPVFGVRVLRFLPVTTFGSKGPFRGAKRGDVIDVDVADTDDRSGSRGHSSNAATSNPPELL